MARREEFSKVSISLPKKLMSEVRRRSGRRGVSAFAARAMRHELERERLGDFLKELENELGPVDAREMAEIDELWPDT